jgi:hypothetical protein
MAWLDESRDTGVTRYLAFQPSPTGGTLNEK